MEQSLELLGGSDEMFVTGKHMANGVFLDMGAYIFKTSEFGVLQTRRFERHSLWC